MINKIKMKKYLALTLIFSCIIFKSNAQSLEKGDILIDGYYGLINLYSVAYIPLFVINNPSDMITNKSIGPIGFRIERMETEKFGIGLDLAYNSSEVTYVNTEDFYSNPNASNNIDSVTGKYHINTYKSSKLGALLSFNIHFANTEKLDAYLTMGLGYGNRKIQESSTDPLILTSNRNALLPISEKFGLGMRYFFTPNIGGNFAVNIGQGGLLNFGLTIKL
jgi:hypothetical protein